MLKIAEVTEYERGTNRFLDAVLENEKVWIVQGSIGRKPIIANSEEEAREKYAAKDRSVDEENEEDEDDEFDI